MQTPSQYQRQTVHQCQQSDPKSWNNGTVENDPNSSTHLQAYGILLFHLINADMTRKCIKITIVYCNVVCQVGFHILCNFLMPQLNLMANLAQQKVIKQGYHVKTQPSFMHNGSLLFIPLNKRKKSITLTFSDVHYRHGDECAKRLSVFVQTVCAT